MGKQFRTKTKEEYLEDIVLHMEKTNPQVTEDEKKRALIKASHFYDNMVKVYNKERDVINVEETEEVLAVDLGNELIDDHSAMGVLLSVFEHYKGKVRLCLAVKTNMSMDQIYMLAVNARGQVNSQASIMVIRKAESGSSYMSMACDEGFPYDAVMP